MRKREKRRGRETGIEKEKRVGDRKKIEKKGKKKREGKRGRERREREVEIFFSVKSHIDPSCSRIQCKHLAAIGHS